MNPYRSRETADTIEMLRICNIPTQFPLEPEEVEAVSAMFVDGAYFRDGFRLSTEQAAALLAYTADVGLFGPIGVGKGKTLITLMVADQAYRANRDVRIALYVPPQVYPQLTKIDIGWARPRLNLQVPFFLLGGKSEQERRSIAESQRAGCYVMPYSLLSTKDSEAVLKGDPSKELRGICPSVIILDEAHCVKNPRAARTRRLMHYVRENKPRLVPLSGTMTSKGLLDYHHLLAYALGKGTPAPLHEAMMSGWAEILDPDYDYDVTGGKATGPLQRLVEWARENFPDRELTDDITGFRHAYQLRLVTAPGVVASGDKTLGVSLTLVNRPVATPDRVEGFDRMIALMKQVEDLWLTPSGDEIELGFHKWRHLFELSAGFYHDLRWPTAEYLTRTGLSIDEAVYFLQAAKAHHNALQEYKKEERSWLKANARQGLDTPQLLGLSMHHHTERHVGLKLYTLWREAKDMEFEGMPQRLSTPVRVCPYKIQHWVKWAKNLEGGGIIWYHHHPMGEWMHEALIAGGVDTLWCPSDSRVKGSNEAIADPANRDKIVVASMKAHGTGKNLQHFYENAFLQVPREAAVFEQVIGRTHRQGQKADSLEPVMANTLDFDHQNQFACLVDAIYTSQTLGAPQKAVFATYDPPPRRFPIEFLAERGFLQIGQVSQEMKKKIDEKLGVLS